jgi:ABC-2 type transport system ATP-binding protein
VISELRDQGTTIVLTTQYLEEADQLAQSISVIDGGHIIAEGTADELKATVGADVIDLVLADRLAVDRAAEVIAATFGLRREDLVVDADLGRIQTPVSGPPALTDALRALDGAQLEVADLTLRRPSLDDVFLTLTGHAAEDRAR